MHLSIIFRYSTDEMKMARLNVLGGSKERSSDFESDSHIKTFLGIFIPKNWVKLKKVI